VSALALRAVERTPLETALPRLETLVSPLTGLVTSVTELLAPPDDARVARVGCSTPDFVDMLGFDADLRPGGWGPTREIALAACLGEVAERYSASCVPRGVLRSATAAELGAEAVPPERFALFHARQFARPGFPFEPFTRTTRVPWVRGFELPGGRPACLPADLVYMPRLVSRNETVARIGYATSNGAACAVTLEEAILRGLLELVERDAFMLAWTGRLSLPVLDWSADPVLLAFERRYLRASGVRYRAVDLSAFHDVPTVLGVVRGYPGDAVALGVGAASAPTVQEAWQRALAEAFAVRAWARLMLADGTQRAFAPDFSDVVEFEDHILFYADRGRARHTRFLDGSHERRETRRVQALDGGDVRAQIEAVCRRLARRGITAYAIDVTAPDIREAGLHVAKVVAPELIPLDVAYEHRFLGGRRLAFAAFELGLRPAPLSFDELNSYPHPFP
jgi:ribosomal protein S12 methylthiotransferase accessory factor